MRSHRHSLQLFENQCPVADDIAIFEYTLKLDHLGLKYTTCDGDVQSLKAKLPHLSYLRILGPIPDAETIFNNVDTTFDNLGSFSPRESGIYDSFLAPPHRESMSMPLHDAVS